MSKYKIACEDVSCDGSEFLLVCKKDGKVVKSRTEYSFDDVLIEVYDFFRECFETFNIDTRFDSVDINICFKY